MQLVPYTLFHVDGNLPKAWRWFYQVTVYNHAISAIVTTQFHGQNATVVSERIIPSLHAIAVFILTTGCVGQTLGTETIPVESLLNAVWGFDYSEHQVQSFVLLAYTALFLLLAMYHGHTKRFVGTV